MPNKYPESRKRGLKPFLKGRSGNPGGRPRTAPLSAALRRLALQCIGGGDASQLKILPKDSVARAAAKSMFMQVIFKGNIAAFAEICDRVEGRADSRIELHGGVSESGLPAPITIRVIEDEAETYARAQERLKKEAILTELSEGGAEHDEAHTDGL
jgi:hypothetical protein